MIIYVYSAERVLYAAISVYLPHLNRIYIYTVCLTETGSNPIRFLNSSIGKILHINIFYSYSDRCTFFGAAFIEQSVSGTVFQ